MTTTTNEATKALKSMKCPRCGAKLYYRDVLNNGGPGWAISTKWGELSDIYGHSYPILIKDFIAREIKR